VIVLAREAAAELLAGVFQPDVLWHEVRAFAEERLQICERKFAVDDDCPELLMVSCIAV
jgi:hypothetical protein